MSEVHVCVVCGHEHDESLEGAWNTLPDDFTCPETGQFKTPPKDNLKDLPIKKCL
jgi:rubredoxin